MKGAVARHRRSRLRHLVWLPVVAILAIVGGLAAPVLFARMFPQQAVSVLRGSLEVKDWTLLAVVTSDTSALVVEIDFVAKDEGNMSPPPWPSVSAVMRAHRMTESLQTRALGPTRFEATLEPAMAGAWTVEIEADGTPLQIPVVVR
ncbi:hypothetical protein [Devosia neptuniae]|jgi:hypothetical protein|uniref:hypothetical protein n=1 Tax=Devosia neptuniae TaxID=191302 RepID=UPI000C95F2C3|nr:hypothetical protein [Devosia neptuniae]MAN44754.1 hypothetical protein [Hyphomonas sp.]MCZ4348114.1 hypothetical protein [Devosia neptuniae]